MCPRSNMLSGWRKMKALELARRLFGHGPRVLLVLIVALGLGLFAGCARKAPQAGMLLDLDKAFKKEAMETSSPAEPEVKEPWREKGIRLAKDKNFNEAVEAFKRAIEEEPEEFFGFNAMAVCYKNMGEYQEAMKNFERALEFAQSQEDEAKVLANIGNLYISAKKPQAALGYYKQAASLVDDHPVYLVLIARTFIRMEERDRARKLLEQAEKIKGNLKKYERDDEKGFGNYLMAQCYSELGDEAKTVEHLESALKQAPDRFVRRIEKELHDERNLLYTLGDNVELKALIERYADKLSPAFWLVRHRLPAKRR